MTALSPTLAREPREYLLAVFIALVLHAGVVAALASVRPGDRPARSADSGFELIALARASEPVVAPAKPSEPEPEPEPESAPGETPPPMVQPQPEVPEPPVAPRVEAETPSVDKPEPSANPSAAPETDTGAVASAVDAAPDGGSEAGVTSYAPPDGHAAYLHNPLPRYPRDARRRRIEGTVVLDVTVDAAGRPARVAVQSSSGFSILDRAALKAVGRWRFEPARRGGVAIAGDVLVPVVFRLENS